MPAADGLPSPVVAAEEQRALPCVWSERAVSHVVQNVEGSLVEHSAECPDVRVLQDLELEARSLAQAGPEVIELCNQIELEVLRALGENSQDSQGRLDPL
jgi:hypothetical protein